MEKQEYIKSIIESQRDKIEKSLLMFGTVVYNKNTMQVLTTDEMRAFFSKEESNEDLVNNVFTTNKNSGIGGLQDIYLPKTLISETAHKKIIDLLNYKDIQKKKVD